MMNMRLLVPLLLAGAAAGVFWLVRNQETPPPPSKESGRQGVIKITPPSGLEKEKPPEKSPPDPSFLLSPSECVTALIAKYSGQQLESWLGQAALYYGKQGPGPAQEFILALPPGGAGTSALVTACEQLVADAPEMILWLTAHRRALGLEWSYAGSERLIMKWGEGDWRSATQFLAGAKELDKAERDGWFTRLLRANDAPRGDQLLDFATSLPDAELREQALLSQAVLEVRLRKSIPDTVQSVLAGGSPELRSQGLTAMLSLLQGMDDRAGLLNGLAAADFEGKSNWISRYCWHWAQSDVNAAMSWAGSLKDTAIRDQVISETWKTVAKYDAPAAEKWIQSISDLQRRAAALAGLRGSQ
jgi:hypothetical protein